MFTGVRCRTKNSITCTPSLSTLILIRYDNTLLRYTSRFLIGYLTIDRSTLNIRFDLIESLQAIAIYRVLIC